MTRTSVKKVSSSGPTTAGNQRWLMLGLVWTAYFSFGYINASLAPFVTLIVEDLGINYTQMGTILGTWQLTYVAFAFAGGSLIDRFGLRRTIGVGLIILTLSAFLRGQATGFATMFVAVALHGLGSPVISIGAPKLVSLWFDGRARSGAAGIYATGPQLGTILMLSTANSIVLPAVGNWRTAMMLYAGVVLTAAALWWALARDRPDQTAAPNESISEMFRASLRLLKVRNVLLLLAIATCYFLIGHSLNNWLPKILEHRGFTPTDAGVLASVPAAMSIISAFTIPRFVTPRVRSRVLIALLLAAATAASLIGHLPGFGLVAGLVVYGSMISITLPMMMLVLVETREVGPSRIGAAGGLMFTFAEVGGFGGPLLMGYLFSQTGGFITGLSVLTIAGVIAAFMARLLRRPA